MADPERPEPEDLPEEPARTPEQQAQVEKAFGFQDGEIPAEPQQPAQRPPEVQAQVEAAFELNDAIPQEPEAAAKMLPRGEAAPHLGQAPAGQAQGLPQASAIPGEPPAAHPAGPAGQTRHARAAQKAADRKTRLQGGVEPPERTQSEGTEQGVRSPGFESIQGANDVAGAMINYQAQLVSTLTTMTRVLLDATSKLEELQNYFEKLR